MACQCRDFKGFMRAFPYKRTEEIKEELQKCVGLYENRRLGEFIDELVGGLYSRRIESCISASPMFCFRVTEKTKRQRFSPQAIAAHQTGEHYFSLYSPIRILHNNGIYHIGVQHLLQGPSILLQMKSLCLNLHQPSTSHTGFELMSCDLCDSAVAVMERELSGFTSSCCN